MQPPWGPWVALIMLLESSSSGSIAWEFVEFRRHFEAFGPLGLRFRCFGIFCLRLGRVQVNLQAFLDVPGALELRMDVSTVAQDSFCRSLGVRWPGPGGPWRALETLMDEPCVI